MPEHYTRNTLECTAYCKRCRRNTQHRVDGGRQGPCIDPDHSKKKPEPGDRPYRVIYMENGLRKQKDFFKFEEALSFFAQYGPALATMCEDKEQLR